jgi:nucleotide-binding universal stress UspA family protein
MSPTPGLADRFRHHPPRGERDVQAHQRIRAAVSQAAHVLDAVMPDGREKRYALMKLEEAMAWGNAGVARNGAGPGEPNLAPNPTFAAGGYAPNPDGRDTIPVPFDRDREQIVSAEQAKEYARPYLDRLNAALDVVAAGKEAVNAEATGYLNNLQIKGTFKADPSVTFQSVKDAIAKFPARPTPPAYDLDALRSNLLHTVEVEGHKIAVGAYEYHDDGDRPVRTTPDGIAALLEAHGVDMAGKTVTVDGEPVTADPEPAPYENGAATRLATDPAYVEEADRDAA